MDNSLQELVRDVLALLGPNGERWTQSAYAQDKNGYPVRSTSDKAVKWCLLGACSKLGHAGMRLELESLGLGAIFNDTHAWYEVKEKLEQLVANQI